MSLLRNDVGFSKTDLTRSDFIDTYVSKVSLMQEKTMKTFRYDDLTLERVQWLPEVPHSY